MGGKSPPRRQVSARINQKTLCIPAHIRINQTHSSESVSLPSSPPSCTDLDLEMLPSALSNQQFCNHKCLKVSLSTSIQYIECILAVKWQNSLLHCLSFPEVFQCGDTCAPSSGSGRLPRHFSSESTPPSPLGRQSS